MSDIIRIPLQVHNFNPLAGYATEGLSLAAISGFLAALTYKTGIGFSKFAIVQGEYVGQVNVHLVQSRDQKCNSKNLPEEPASMTGERHADIQVSIYAKVDRALTNEDLITICDAINSSKFQGGTLLKLLTPATEETSANKTEAVSFLRKYTSYADAGIELDAELYEIISQVETKIHTLIVKPIHDKQEDETLIAYFARKLSLASKNFATKDIIRKLEYVELSTKHVPSIDASDDESYLLMCNGYLQHATAMLESKSNHIPVLEPSFMLVSAVPVYKTETLLENEYTTELENKFWFESKISKSEEGFISYLVV